MVSESGAVRLLGIRVTDYENLLSYNNDVGGDLNLLREKDADDKLFSVLDSLDNINDFNEIIGNIDNSYPLQKKHHRFTRQNTIFYTYPF